GIWDISEAIAFSPTATTVITSLTFGTNTVADTVPSSTIWDLPSITAATSRQRISILGTTITPGNTNSIGLPVETFRIILTAQITLYLAANAAFSASTLTALGWLQARRVR